MASKIFGNCRVEPVSLVAWLNSALQLDGQLSGLPEPPQKLPPGLCEQQVSCNCEPTDTWHSTKASLRVEHVETGATPSQLLPTAPKQVPTEVPAAPHSAGLDTSLLKRMVSLPDSAPHA